MPLYYVKDPGVKLLLDIVDAFKLKFDRFEALFLLLLIHLLLDFFN